jgi:radical SAM protein with 4Fe4S-binding SPASM domain
MGKPPMNILRKLKNLIETNLFLSKLFDIIAGSILYKKIINKKIIGYTESIKKSKRYNVIIETTNICNAKCIMCPHTKMQRRMGVMDNEVFELIVKKLKADRISPLAFILNGFGEPLADKKIFERIALLKKEFPQSVLKFYSNLGLANEDATLGLVSSGLDEINVSFNGYDKENYEDTMKISYQKTLENLRRLIAKKNEVGSKLKIRISMTLVSHNDGDEKKFIKEWSGQVDSVSVNKIHTYNNSVEDVSGKNKINYKKLTYPCKYLWNTLVFGVSGDMFLCCLDYEGEYNFGNIREKGVLEIFYSEAFENIRKKHLENNIKNIKMCANCYTPYKNGVEWLVNDLY